MEKTHHNICPRNCYDTCSIISTTRNGKLISVEGNPLHEYTQGKLCPKALEDVKRVYSPRRIRYPMRQKGRYSGYWERISWDGALNIIAETILKLKEKYGTTLPVALDKYSGNFGLLHYATDALFTGLGPTTRAIGSPCWSAGVDAQTYDFGTFFCSDPLDMRRSKLIWLWGVNPAWTAPHQMPIILDAMDNGTKVVCFDTYFSATAARAHRFIQVRPGTDGLLALGLAKVIVEEKLVDPELASYTLGHQEFMDYLQTKVDLRDCSAITGVPMETLRELAIEYGKTHPASIWVGFGLQRYINGGQTLRSIDALGALAGHIGESGGGVQYGQFETYQYSSKVTSYFYDQPTPQDRLLNINNFAEQALECTDPPVKMLWLAGRNPLSQDGNLHLWKTLLKQLDLIMICDLFPSQSSQAADLFLPITTQYEHWDLNSSYWHYWVGVNEPAIAPVGEARSDLQIAWDISARLNQISPGSCKFPTAGDEKGTLLNLLGPTNVVNILDLKNPEDILEGPLRAQFPLTAWENRKFKTPSGRFEFYSESAERAGFPALPIYRPSLEPCAEFPLRLITPHHLSCINSQPYALDHLQEHFAVHLSPEVAKRYELKEGEKIRIGNRFGVLEGIVAIENGLPDEAVFIYQEQIKSDFSLNRLMGTPQTDMGHQTQGAPGFALNETFVNLRKIN